MFRTICPPAIVVASAADLLAVDCNLTAITVNLLALLKQFTCNGQLIYMQCPADLVANAHVANVLATCRFNILAWYGAMGCGCIPLEANASADLPIQERFRSSVAARSRNAAYVLLQLNPRMVWVVLPQFTNKQL